MICTCWSNNITRLQVLSILGRHSVHRVPVLSRETGKITKLITQSAVVKWFAHVWTCIILPSQHSCSFGVQDAAALAVLKESTVESSGVGLKSVITASSDAPIIQALELMLRNHLNGVCLGIPARILRCSSQYLIAGCAG
jgi:CBS domain-containing protein